MPISLVGYLHSYSNWNIIPNLYQAKMSSSSTFLQLNLPDMTSKEVMQISFLLFLASQIPPLTSYPATLTAKKSMKMKFSPDKIYYKSS